MMSTIPVQAELAEVYPESYEVFMQCFFHVSNSITSTPEQTIINNMATFKYSAEDNGKSSDSKTKSAMTRIRKKLDMRYFPSRERQPQPKPGDTGVNAKSNKPRSSTRKRPAPLIDLDKDDFAPDTKRPRRNSRRSRGRGKGSAAGRPEQKGRDEKPEKGKKGTNETDAALQGKEGGDGTSDDTFDISRAPEGWGSQHSVLQLMSGDPPSSEYLKCVRRHDAEFDRRLEQAWDQENQLMPTIGSSNTRALTDPSPYLRSIHHPKDHRAHVFVPVQHFKVMRQLVRLWGAYSELFSSKGDGDKSIPIEAR